MAADFTRGAAFVALAGAHQAADPAAMVCMQLGLHAGEGESALGTLVQVLGPSRLLLVLDSVEHLDRAPAVVAEILHACPGVTQLVTSRAPLELSAEQCYVVPPLALEPAMELFLSERRFRQTPLGTPSPKSVGASTHCRWRSSSPPPRRRC